MPESASTRSTVASSQPTTAAIPPTAGLRHQGAAPLHQAQPGLEVEDAGGEQGGVLAEAVADQVVGRLGVLGEPVEVGHDTDDVERRLCVLGTARRRSGSWTHSSSIE
ncbi:hypothetical protein SVIOM74S_07297 [Streptomyces violarus]